MHATVREPMRLRSRLQEGYGDLAPAQRRLASFLLDNFASASDYTIKDLADAAGVSIGTISQLCRRLGLRGYQDLRLTLARETVMLEASADRHRPALPPGPSEAARAAERIFGAAIEALADTAAQADLGAFGAAVSALAAARRIECVGIGTAGLVAQEAALKLRKLGLDAVAHPDAHVQAMSAALLDPGDVLLAISHSGRTIDTLRTTRVAHDGGATVIAITRRGRSPLAEATDIRLATVTSDAGFQVEPTTSTIAALAIVDVLFVMLLERGAEAAEEQLYRTQAAVEERYVSGRVG